MLLLDTNVVSYIFKRDDRAEFYLQHLQGHEPAISFMTLAELYKWPLERNWGEKKLEELYKLVRLFVLLPYDDLLVRTWAQIVVDGKKSGVPRDFSDSWIAATAVRHELALLTHNRRHFEGINNLRIISQH
jgi:predicted nucleic acid-binding protein